MCGDVDGGTASVFMSSACHEYKLLEIQKESIRFVIIMDFHNSTTTLMSDVHSH